MAVSKEQHVRLPRIFYRRRLQPKRESTMLIVGVMRPTAIGKVDVSAVSVSWTSEDSSSPKAIDNASKRDKEHDQDISRKRVGKTAGATPRCQVDISFHHPKPSPCQSLGSRVDATSAVLRSFAIDGSDKLTARARTEPVISPMTPAQL